MKRESNIRYAKCSKCHGTVWQNYKCTICGNNIENIYVGNDKILEQLRDIVKENE